MPADSAIASLPSTSAKRAGGIRRSKSIACTCGMKRHERGLTALRPTTLTHAPAIW